MDNRSTEKDTRQHSEECNGSFSSTLNGVIKESTRFFLQALLQDLREMNYDDQSIRQELISKNSELPYPFNEEDLQAFIETNKLNEEKSPSPSPAPQPQEILEKAIASGDVEQLLTNANIAYLANMKRLSPVAYGVTEHLIKETFGKKLNMATFKQCVAAEIHRQKTSETGEKFDVATVAYDWATRHRDEWAYDEGVQCWRIWNGDYWKGEADKSSFLDQYATAALQEAGHAVNSSQALNLFQRIAASHCKRNFEHAPNKINFADRTLDTTTMQAWPHDRDDNFTYCLPYSYDEYGKYPTIESFLVQSVPDLHARQAFKAQIGLSLLGDTLMHFVDMIIGPPRSGKSTLLQLVNATCGIAPSDFGGYTLFIPELEGKRARFKMNQKRACCIDELPVEALRHEETFKSMSAHSGVEIRGIGRDEQEDNQWKPKLFLAMNEKPHYKDTSGAIKERLVPIEVPYTRSRDQRDLLLFEKMRPEIGAFAADCIRHALAARDRGYIPFSASMKQIMNDMETVANPLKSFMAEFCILDPDGFVFVDVFFSAYKEYCDGGTSKALSKIKMGNALTEMGKGIQRTHKRNHLNFNKVERALSGIRLLTEQELQARNEEDADGPKEEDDALLLMDVDDVDDVLTTSKPCRQHGKQASQDALQSLVDDVDDFFEKSNIEQNSVNSHLRDTQFSSENMFSKKSSTSSTGHANGHQKPCESVDDFKTMSSTSSTSLSEEEEQFEGEFDL